MEFEEFRDKEKRLAILAKLKGQGVDIIDPEHTYIESTVKIGRGTQVHPYVFIYLDTAIGEDCVIWPFTVILGAEIGNSVAIGSFSKIHGAEIKDGSMINSHSYLGPDTVILKPR